MSANGRVKPDWVIVDGIEEKAEGGAYYIEWQEANRRVRLSVGKDAPTALTRKLRKEAELRAIAQGVTVVPYTAGGPDASSTGNPSWLQHS